MVGERVASPDAAAFHPRSALMFSWGSTVIHLRALALALALALAAPSTLAQIASTDALPASAPPRGEAERRAATLFSGPTSTGAVALTFDDGPHPRFTPRLLQLLQRERVPAAFFLIGQQVKLYPQVARQIAEAGFEIGNHSMTHANLRAVTADKMEFEIVETQRLIQEATGQRPTLFRAPYGNTDDEVFKILHRERLTAINWSIDPLDWDASNSSRAIEAAILERAQPGSIVLVHDIHERTIDAIPGVIAGLRAKGLKFITLAEMIAAEKADFARRQAEAAAIPPAASTNGPRGLPPPPPTVGLDKTSLNRYRITTRNPPTPTPVPTKTPPPDPPSR
jgi:peptidoglycan/xylan/chitin deacetylase (PgdA/CDA1 family)